MSADDMILYTENSKDYRKTAGINKRISKVSGHKINI